MHSTKKHIIVIAIFTVTQSCVACFHRVGLKSFYNFTGTVSCMPILADCVFLGSSNRSYSCCQRSMDSLALRSPLVLSMEVQSMEYRQGWSPVSKRLTRRPDNRERERERVLQVFENPVYRITLLLFHTYAITLGLLRYATLFSPVLESGEQL